MKSLFSPFSFGAIRDFCLNIARCEFDLVHIVILSYTYILLFNDISLLIKIQYKSYV